MNPQAVQEAKIRLDRARNAFSAMRPDCPFPEFATAWWTYLLAASGVYSKLEQGAKGHGPSEAWFGRIKHVRKKDPLLSYLHHARNSEEHGLGESATIGIVAVKSLNKGIAVSASWTKAAITSIKINTEPDANVQPGESVAEIQLGYNLWPVKDERFKDTFHPPASHLGQPLKIQSAEEVARLGLAYLEGLIAEAATFVV